MNNNLIGKEIWDYENDRIITVERCLMHDTYECRIFGIEFDENGNDEMTGDGELTLLTRADVERAERG